MEIPQFLRSGNIIYCAIIIIRSDEETNVWHAYSLVVNYHHIICQKAQNQRGFEHETKHAIRNQFHYGQWWSITIEILMKCRKCYFKLFNRRIFPEQKQMNLFKFDCGSSLQFPSHRISIKMLCLQIHIVPRKAIVDCW